MDLLTSVMLLSSFVGMGDTASPSPFTEVPGNRYVINKSIPLKWIDSENQDNVVTGVAKKDKAKKENAKKAKSTKKASKKTPSKKNHAKKEESKKKNVKPADVKKEEPKKDEVKPADVKNEEPKKDEVKPADVKKEEPKKDEVKPADVKKEEPKKEEAKPADVKKEEPKKDEVKPADVKKEEPKKEEVKPADVKKEEPKKEETKPKYETVDIKAKKLKVVKDFSACLVPEKVYPISLNITEFENSFRVVSVKPSGSKVSKGEQVIELDLEAYDRSLADMRRNVKGLELSFQKAQAAIATARKTHELDILEAKQSAERAQDNYKHFWEVEWPARLEAVEFSAKLSKMRLDAQTEEYEQLKKMYEADDLVEHEEEFLIKRAKLDLEVAQFNYKQSTEAYKRNKAVELPNSEKDYKQRYQRLEATLKEQLAIVPLAIKEAELEFEGQKIVLERAKIKLERMETQREILECKAPEDGIFLYGTFENNQYSGFDLARNILKPDGMVPRKKTIGVIVSGNMSLTITIPEKLWSSMENGIKGWFTANTYPDSELSVTLNSFTEFPVAEGEYQGTVQLSDSRPTTMKLQPGMKGKVELVLTEKAKAIMIPSSALGRDGSTTQRYVYVLKGDKAVKRTVKIGYSNDKEIEIIDSLESGEKVVKDWTTVEEDE